MPRAKQRAAAISGTPDDIETSFYEALQAGDLDRLMACWADEDDILCIHPGGARLTGAGAIRSAYETLFAQAGSIQAYPQRTRKIESLTSAVHSVLELIKVMTEQGPHNVLLLATNVYHKTAQGWRMVAHHVSTAAQQDLLDDSDAPAVLH